METNKRLRFKTKKWNLFEDGNGFLTILRCLSQILK